jgi:hypothetical protein
MKEIPIILVLGFRSQVSVSLRAATLTVEPFEPLIREDPKASSSQRGTTEGAAVLRVQVFGATSLVSFDFLAHVSISARVSETLAKPATPVLIDDSESAQNYKQE